MKLYTLYARDPMGRDFALVDEDGNKIEGVYEFVVRGSAREITTAEIYIMPMAANMQVVLREVNFICPSCQDIVSHECEDPETATLGGGS